MIPAGYEGSNLAEKIYITRYHYPWNHLRINGFCLSLMLLTKKCIEIIAKKGFPINVRCEITDTIYAQTA